MTKNELQKKVATLIEIVRLLTERYDIDYDRRLIYEAMFELSNPIIKIIEDIRNDETLDGPDGIVDRLASFIRKWDSHQDDRKMARDIIESEYKKEVEKMIEDRAKLVAALRRISKYPGRTKDGYRHKDLADACLDSVLSEEEDKIIEGIDDDQ